MTQIIQKQTTETKRDIRSLIQSDQVKQQMSLVLPKHLTADRMARVACTAILKTPKLAACKPESLLQALMLCSQAGLEPDGRNAHLIPYGDQVQVIFDWKGLVSLARRNGICNIAADVVCENDEFEWNRDGDGLHFKHTVNYRKPRGNVFAAFCIWKDGEGQFDGEVMTKDEIEAIRKRSRAGNAGPWVTDWNEMAKKTVVRRSSKKWPLDAELAEALNDADSVVQASPPAARPIFNSPSVALPEMAEEPKQIEAPADDVPMDNVDPAPAPEPAKPAPAPKVEEKGETAREFVTRMLGDAGVPFDDLRDFISAKNISNKTDEWGSIDDVPESVFTVLSQAKTLSSIIKIYGKKA